MDAQIARRFAIAILCISVLCSCSQGMAADRVDTPNEHRKMNIVDGAYHGVLPWNHQYALSVTIANEMVASAQILEGGRVIPQKCDMDDTAITVVYSEGTGVVTGLVRHSISRRPLESSAGKVFIGVSGKRLELVVTNVDTLGSERPPPPSQ